MAKSRNVRTLRHGALVAAMLLTLTACGGDWKADSGTKNQGSTAGTPATGGGTASGNGGSPAPGSGPSTNTPPPAPPVSGAGGAADAPPTGSGPSSGGSGSPSPAGSGPTVPPPTSPLPTQPVPPVEEPSPSDPKPPVASGENPFDSYYASSFRLSSLSTNPIVPANMPLRATGYSTAFIDPAYGTRIYHASAAADGTKARSRHEYSRRQAFNADNSRYMTVAGDGAMHLYDGSTFQRIKTLPFSAESEAIWHPTDPKLVYHTTTYGGLVWFVTNVDTGSKSILFDFTGKTPWPQARSFWSKGEGTMSADGRYLALMATAYSNETKQNTIYGLLMFDVVQKKIVGTLDASKFPKPGAFPDHISTSATGKYAVPSWGKGEGGTRAYTRDFSSSKLLLDNSQHSDLALGPNREDMYVYTDYDSGYMVARNIDTLASFNITPIYQGDHESYAAHVSGQGFDKPGWAVISTYSDSARWGSIAPVKTEDLRREYRKVFLAELKPNGRLLNVAHIRASEFVAGNDYFAEPQASASRDLSRIIFTSTFGKSDPDDYIIGLPSWWDKSK